MAIPDRIGRYRIVRLIGTGAASTVFEAHDEDLDVPVAVKVLAENWLHREDVVSSFLREARLLRSLEDPRVVAVHDIGRLDSGQPFLVMDLLPPSLSDRLAGSGADPAAARRLGHELARALEVLHSRGIVHRDVKPANMFVVAPDDAEGPFPPGATLVLGDFGLAGTSGDSGRSGGTPGYMAPEQTRHDTVDERADIYAAAAVVHRVATGQLPPRGELPADLRPAVEAGLAPDPSNRPASIGELADLMETSPLRSRAPAVALLVATVVVVTVIGGVALRRAGSGSSTGPTEGPPDNGPAETGPVLFGPRGVDAAAGLIAVADTENHRIVVIEGDRTSVFEGFRSPSDVLVSPDGSIMVADTGSNRILRLSGGSITTVAGDGRAGFSGDGGPAQTARLDRPMGIGFDQEGNLLVADTGNHRVRRIADGIIETLAGNGLAADSGDGGPAIGASLLAPVDAVGWEGGIALVDRDANRVRWIAPEGQIVTVAGTGSPRSDGDGGQGFAASLLAPTSVTAVSDGSLVVADGAGALRRLSPDGTISTLIGSLTSPRGVGEDAGSFFTTEPGRRGLLRADPDGQVAELVTGEPSGPIGDGGPASAASLLDPRAAVLIDGDRLVIADRGHSALRIVGEGGIVTSAPVWIDAVDLVSDGRGSLIAAVPSEHRVVRIDVESGTVTTVAGTGRSGDRGDGGLATAALLRRPEGIAVDDTGTVYIADSEAHRVRAVSPEGVIRTVVGTGEPGAATSSDPTDIRLNGPVAVAVGGEGELYVADEGNRRILLISDGSVEVLAQGIDSPDRLAVADGGVFVLSASRVLRLSGDDATPVVELGTDGGDIELGEKGLLITDTCRGTVSELVDGELTQWAGRPVESCP